MGLNLQSGVDPSMCVQISHHAATPDDVVNWGHSSELARSPRAEDMVLNWES